MRAGTMIVGLMLTVAAVPAGPAWGVPGNGNGSGNGRGKGIVRVDATGATCPGARFTRIQDAVDAARPNGIIVVCAGTYAEQLVIAKKVRIIGQGRPVVRPAGMVANTTSMRTDGPIAAAAVVSGGATLDGLEFDLSANGLPTCGATDPVLVGIFVRGSAATLKNNRVHDVRHAASGCESGAGVLVQGNNATSTRVDVNGNVVFAYQRAGIVVNERGARALIRNNTVTGDGVTADVVQNGIQVGFGATATVSNNVVQNNAGPSGPACTFDGGNLLFESSGGTITGNTFTGNTAGVIVNGSRNRILRNTVDGLSGAVVAGLDGISVFGDRNSITSNTVRNVSEVGIRLFGSANTAVKTTVSDTHAATLCEATRALPGCAEVLSVCGVGLWIAGGSGNAAVRNTLVNNDVALRDEGLQTVHRRDN
jgi:parallel beta-helix repeat protein